MNKASQFLPFDGLRGWKGMIQEKRRPREPRRDISEDRAAWLNAMLHRIQKRDMLRITFYNGKTYDTLTGQLTELDTVYRVLKLDSTSIRFTDLWDIEIL